MKSADFIRNKHQEQLQTHLKKRLEKDSNVVIIYRKVVDNEVYELSYRIDPNVVLVYKMNVANENLQCMNADFLNHILLPVIHSYPCLRVLALEHY